MMQVQLARLLICAQPNSYSALMDVFDKRTKDSVPDGKDGSIIGVTFPYDHRMMNPVHGRGDKKEPV